MVEKENSKKGLEPKLLEKIIAAKSHVMKKKKIKKHNWLKLIGIVDLDEPSDAVKEHNLICNPNKI